MSALTLDPQRARGLRGTTRVGEWTGNVLLKWIDCHVPAERRDAFSRAQEQWDALRDVTGFVGQVGGWQRGEPDRAGILAVWDDRVAHDAFMGEIHDRIVDGSGQAETYDRLAVTLFEEILDMPGAAGDMASAVEQGTFLRVADCVLHPKRRDHFVEVQRDVWRLGMSRTDGMLGGVCGEACGKMGTVPDNHVPPRFLVATLWESATANDAYVAATLPSLRVRAKPQCDIARLEGWAIVLEPRWRVTPVAKT